MKFHPVVSSAFLSASLLTSICCVAQGQAAVVPVQDALVHLTLKQAASFPEALKSLAAQGHVAFVAEGSPFRPTLDDAKAPDLQKDVPLSTAVEKIAGAYDYTATRQGNVFVLEKNYTNPDDLPGVTLAECLLAVKDVSLVLAGFDPHLPRHYAGQDDPLIADLIRSLTPAQTQAMQNGSLSVAGLSSEQKSFVYRIGLFLYVGSSLESPVGSSAYALAKLPTYAVGVGDWRFSAEQTFPHLFGYRVSASSDVRAFQPFEGVTVSNGVVVNQTVDVTGPPPPALLPVDAGQTTLVKAVAALAADGKKPVTVDAALQEKPVTVAGAENAPPAQVLTALADVYGLRVRTDEHGARFLTRVAFRIPLEVTGIPQEVRRVLPLPLLHKIHDSAVQQSRPPWDQLVANGGQQVFENIQEAKQRVKQIRDTMDMASATREAELKCLYAAVAPQLKAAPGQFIPFTKLPEQARQAFTLYEMADVLGWVLNDLTPELPVNLTRPDSIVLVGGPYTDSQGKAKFSLTLKYVSPNGQALDVFGLSNMEVSMNGSG